MLYIGNFSYTDNREDTDNICLMPLMVEASSADAALERFTELLRITHEESDLMDGASSIYLESLIEFDELPDEPVIVRWQKIYSAEDGLYSVLTPLPGHEDLAEAYTWSADDEELVDLSSEPTAEEIAEELTATLEILFSDDDDEGAEANADGDDAFLTF